MKYEFFVAYASEDQSFAEDLAWELADRHRIAFFDAGHIPFGSRWDEVLTNAITSSRVTVILVSKHSAGAHYEQDEIARAVRQARRPDSDRTVVPVLLEGAGPDDLPYGLAVVQALDGTLAGGMKRVAKSLDTKFPRETVAPTPVRRWAYDHAGVALRLDRTRQWNQILEASHFAESSVFLFHGDTRQNVGLFVSRIEHFFSQQIKEPCTVRRVPFNIGGATPRTGADWLGHLRAAFECQGPLAVCLRKMAKNQRLVAVLCDSPLPAIDLRPSHIAALEQFLTIALPELMAEIESPGALSLLVTFDYAGQPPPIIDRAIQWCRQAEHSGHLRSRPLPPASLPSWDEISDYVSALSPQPTNDHLHSMRARFDHMVALPELTFDQIARFIETSVMIGD